MNATLITVVPTYNGERLLGETLACLVEQTRKPDRVVVMDDGSTDRTREVAEQFADLLDLEWVGNENIGSLGNHNRGLRYAAETEWLHFLHQDDLVHPQFYEAVTAYAMALELDGRSLAWTLPKVGSDVSRLDFTLKTSEGGVLKPAEDFIRQRRRLAVVNPSSVVFRTDRKPSPCRFSTEFPMVGDQVFMARYAAACREVLWMDGTWCLYRVNPRGDTARVKATRMRAWVCDELDAMGQISRLLHGGRATFSAWLFCRAWFVLRTAGKMRDHPAQGAEILWLAGLRFAGWRGVCRSDRQRLHMEAVT